MTHKGMDATEAALEAEEAARRYQDIELDRHDPLRWSVFLTLTIEEASMLRATCISAHAVWSFDLWLRNNADDILKRILRLDHEYLVNVVPEAVFHRTRLSLTQP